MKSSIKLFWVIVTVVILPRNFCFHSTHFCLFPFPLCRYQHVLTTSALQSWEAPNSSDAPMVKTTHDKGTNYLAQIKRKMVRTSGRPRGLIALSLINQFMLFIVPTFNIFSLPWVQAFKLPFSFAVLFEPIAAHIIPSMCHKIRHFYLSISHWKLFLVRMTGLTAEETLIFSTFYHPDPRATSTECTLSTTQSRDLTRNVCP